MLLVMDSARLPLVSSGWRGCGVEFTTWSWSLRSLCSTTATMGVGLINGGGNSSKVMQLLRCASSTMGGVSIESMVLLLLLLLLRTVVYPSETATNALVTLRLCCNRSLICDRRDELLMGVLRLMKSAGTEPLRRTNPVEQLLLVTDILLLLTLTFIEEAVVSNAFACWYCVAFEAVVVALPNGGTDGTAHELYAPGRHCCRMLMSSADNQCRNWAAMHKNVLNMVKTKEDF